MTTAGRRIATAVSGMLIVGLAVSGCDSTEPDPPSSGPEPTTTTPSPTPTAVVSSAVTVAIRPSKQQLSVRQQQVMSAFAEFTTARNRFFSHPWIVDPVYLSLVLPGSPYLPDKTDVVGLIGPVTIHVLSVEDVPDQQVKVNYCVDDRGLRYLGRDGKVDVPGPAGDKLRSTVAFQATQFKFTADAAVDGKPAKSPRWLAATGESSDGERCKAVSAMPQPPPPTQTTVAVPS